MSGNVIQVWGGTQWYPIDTGVIVPPGGADSPYITTSLQKSLPLAMTSGARYNNPRVNAVMTTPPTITISTTHNAALTKAYGWNGGPGGASIYDPPTGNGPFVYSGGFPTSTGYGAVDFPSVHYETANYQSIVKRMETNADSIKIEFGVFPVSADSASTFRVIVDRQYVSLTPSTFTTSGTFNFVTVDFTASGGRKMRNIILEATTGVKFGSVTSVGATETLQRPGGVIKKMYVVADSWGVGTTTTIMNTFPHYLGDLLGFRNVWNGGVPATGWLADNFGAGLTCRGRIRDYVDCSPDLLVITMGFNDAASNMTALQNEVALTLRTIRQQPVLSAIPIILCPFGGNHFDTTQSIPVENAVRAGMTALNDSAIYFVASTGDPNGPWMTGTGSAGGTHGDGNCDVYISTDAVHPNDAGHAYLAGRLADEITRLVNL